MTVNEWVYELRRMHTCGHACKSTCVDGEHERETAVPDRLSWEIKWTYGKKNIKVIYFFNKFEDGIFAKKSHKNSTIRMQNDLFVFQVAGWNCFVKFSGFSKRRPFAALGRIWVAFLFRGQSQDFFSPRETKWHDFKALNIQDPTKTHRDIVVR